MNLIQPKIFLQPYVRGRILYTPDTKATQNLMKIVNQAFSPVENLRNFTQDYTEKYSKRIRKLLMNSDTQEMLKDIVITNGTDSIFDSFSQSSLGKFFYYSLVLKNGILLPNLFWPTVRKNWSSDLKMFANSRPSASNFKSFSQSLEYFTQTVKVQ